ncbi:TLD domain-containing protein 2 isoform 1-T1 [Liasis olivaceus]
MKTPHCRYILLPDLGDETLSLEPEQEADGLDSVRTNADAPSLVAEELNEPVLNAQSSILHTEEIQQLTPHLPLRVTGYPWNLVYCTARDGFSLKTMYRSMNNLASPVLLVIRDTDGQIFGAFSSTAIHVSSCFYGNGETFLFSFSPQLKVFKWTGKNTFFMKGDADSLAIGGGRYVALKDGWVIRKLICQYRMPAAILVENFISSSAWLRKIMNWKSVSSVFFLTKSTISSNSACSFIIFVMFIDHK